MHFWKNLAKPECVAYMCMCNVHVSICVNLYHLYDEHVSPVCVAIAANTNMLSVEGQGCLQVGHTVKQILESLKEFFIFPRIVSRWATLKKNRF